MKILPLFLAVFLGACVITARFVDPAAAPTPAVTFTHGETP